MGQNGEFKLLLGDEAAPGRLPRIDPSNTKVIIPLALAALAAVAILVVDHFSRVSHPLLFASAFLICATVFYTLTLSLLNRSATASAAEAERVRAASSELSPYCVVSVNIDHRIVEWNQAAAQVFGYSREEAICADALELLVPENRREEYRALFGAFAEIGESGSDGRYVETELLDSAGRPFPVEISFARITDDPPMFTGFIRSLTERRQHEEENSRLAAIVRSSDDAIVSVDLEGRIMSWNEGAESIYGCPAEEAIGQRLNELTFPPDGHEQLGTLFRRVTSGASGEMKGERVTRDGTPLWVKSRAFPIRDLYGDITGMSLISQDISEEVRRTEKAQRDRERKQWCDLIEESLERDGFVFWAQPVFHSGSPVLSHYELLIRMVHDGRTVMPDEFLAYAEECGLITKIDRWAARTGIAISRDIPVAINLSGPALTDKGMVPFIGESIREAGVDPSRIRFEITETSAIENLKDASLTVKALKDLGCLVSLDDFGTGYSSFTYLKYLPVDELKIDMSFIRDLTSSDASHRVVDSMIATAGNFSISTVAEGIEDRETADEVVQLGIDLSQGYFLGRPAPLDDVLANRGGEPADGSNTYNGPLRAAPFPAFGQSPNPRP